MGCGDSFAYQKPFFENYFKVYAPDMKGFGKNADMQYPYALCDYVADLVKYFNDNGIKKPCVVAHSFGARVVLKALSIYPDMFSKIVITGGAGLKPKKTFKKRLNALAFKVLKVFVKRGKLVRFYSKDYINLSPVMKESFKKITGEYLDGVLPTVKAPTLLIFGAHDTETPLYFAKRFNKNIKGSTLKVYKNAGHFAFIDCPLKFNMEVKEFLLS